MKILIDLCDMDSLASCVDTSGYLAIGVEITDDRVGQDASLDEVGACPAVRVMHSHAVCR